jgi:hypothetical protein
MANGEQCKRCSEQETGHILGYAILPNGEPCEKFESETEHREDCPVLGCRGNCQKTIQNKRVEIATSIVEMNQRGALARRLYGDWSHQ